MGRFPCERSHHFLVGGPGPPLWKIWVRQLGWWQKPNINGKIKVIATSHHQPVTYSITYPKKESHRYSHRFMIFNHDIFLLSPRQHNRQGNPAKPTPTLRPCVRGTFEELRGPLGKGKLQAAQRGFLGELTMAAMAAMVSLFMAYDAYEWLWYYGSSVFHGFMVYELTFFMVLVDSCDSCDSE